MSVDSRGAGQRQAALQVVTWIGTITAVFAASIAVAQTDIKRILAYSTVSQLGFMMLGLGVGGVAVGMFHLITHAFFKALLFLGAGSVIHGCRMSRTSAGWGAAQAHACDFRDLRCRHVGFERLSAVLLRVSGARRRSSTHAQGWITPAPFYLGVFAALLTAFYMTRQVCYVFFGSGRSSA